MGLPFSRKSSYIHYIKRQMKKEMKMKMKKEKKMKRSIDEINFLKGRSAFLIGWKIEDCGFLDDREKVQWINGFREAEAEV